MINYKKLVIVGKDGVGKTSMMITYSSNEFPLEYVPTVGRWTGSIQIGEDIIQFSPIDTAGGDDYDKLRPLSYNKTHVFILCAAVNDRDSFDLARDKFYPEIQFYCQCPVILVGTKSDLRDTEDCISMKEAVEISTSLGCIEYIECSALQMKRLNEVFEKSLLNAVKYTNYSNIVHKRSKCTLL